MSERVWFITGVTGFVGGEVLRRLLRRTEDRVFGLVRAASDDALTTKLDKLVAKTIGEDLREAFDARFEAVRGDISRDGLGLSDVDRERVVDATTRIIHSAASVRFDLPLDEARLHNVKGTDSILDLAQQIQDRGHLERVGYIGTCYVAGDRKDVVKADELDVGQGFRNTYEQTKLESEQRVREHWDRLPIAVFRPSIIVGDSRTGRTQSFNVIYWPLQIYAKGMWPDFFVGDLDAPSDVVPVNFVADALLYLLDQPSSEGQCFHLAAGLDKCTTNRVIMEMASRYFERPIPEVIDPDDFGMEERARRYEQLSPTQRTLIAQGIQYLPYFTSNPLFDNSNTVEALAGTDIEPLAVDAYFEKLFDYCKRSHWGRRPVED